MLNSMTAFGRGVVEKNIGRFSVEVHSLNRRYLEISIEIPSELSPFETDLRKFLGERIGRGKITVRVHASYPKQTPYKLIPNRALLAQLQDGWSLLCDQLEIKNSEEGLRALLLKYSDELFDKQEGWNSPSEVKEALLEAATHALIPFHEAQQAEGEHIQKDLENRLNTLSKLVEQMDQFSAESKAKAEQTLRERLEEALPGRLENEERLLREVTLYATKLDISEEITRLKSHIQHFKSDIEQSERPIGKKLDFLTQEMTREWNTIGSKSNHLEISKRVVEGKEEIEKIREQVQNVE